MTLPNSKVDEIVSPRVIFYTMGSKSEDNVFGAAIRKINEDKYLGVESRCY